MSTFVNAATERYKDGSYGVQHPGWHIEDARAKAMDLTPGLSELVRRFDRPRLRMAEIGAGVGGVLIESVNVLRRLAPKLAVAPTGFDISPQAVEAAREMFPELEMHCKLFDAEDGPFDAVLLVDVLEHLENPWDLLRTARDASQYLLIRQPLLDNLCTFRHNHYAYQREHWGHIAFFTSRSFLDMAQACGWNPCGAKLVAPWELTGCQGKPGILRRALCGYNRDLASYFMNGFYLNGLFQRG